MKNALSKDEALWLDNAFADPRLRETRKADEASAETLRLAAAAFACVILEQCPTSADRSAALRLVRDTYATAHASLSQRLPRV